MNIKKEQLIYTILLISGFVVLIVGATIVKMTGFDNLIRGISGLGGSWIVISGIKLYQIKKRPEKYEEQIIGHYDERNMAIRGYAGYATFITTLLTIGIMFLIFMWLDYTIPMLIGVGLLLIHIISFLFFSRYYGKKI